MPKASQNQRTTSKRIDKSNTKSPQRSLNATYELIYVTKTPNDLNEGDLSRYLKNDLKITDHSCHLVVPFNKRRSELRYLNFKVRVLSSDVDYLLQKNMWPLGVEVRKWKTGYERCNEVPPFKQDFHRR